MNVMSAIDFIDAHMLPFFSTEASTGKPKIKSSQLVFMENHSKPILVNRTERSRLVLQ
jgi:hypothetical protein